VGHALRSTGLLHLEVSRVMISKSVLKTGGDVMTYGACGIIVKVASR
jgi:hypothetical protein